MWSSVTYLNFFTNITSWCCMVPLLRYALCSVLFNNYHYTINNNCSQHICSSWFSDNRISTCSPSALTRPCTYKEDTHLSFVIYSIITDKPPHRNRSSYCYRKINISYRRVSTRKILYLCKDKVLRILSVTNKYASNMSCYQMSCMGTKGMHISVQQESYQDSRMWQIHKINHST